MLAYNPQPTTDEGWLKFGSDIGLRRQYFCEASFAHPAKLHLGLLEWLLVRYTQPGDTMLDPMAGVGSILLAATMQRNVIAREIEPKWLEHCHQNAANILRSAGMFAGSIDVGQADARQPWNVKTDHVIFSPPYGCGATRGNARKGILSPKTRELVAKGELSGDWVRLATQTESGQAASCLFWYGGHPAQIGHIRGRRYWQEMEQVYKQARASLRGGYMVVIIKDHIKDFERVMVADQTVQLCEQLGFRLHARHKRLVHPLSLWQRRRKERGEPVVEDEDALVFVKAGAA
jgi:tRNA G10  N-methylase Trm11